jgi:hypothetical protein
LLELHFSPLNTDFAAMLAANMRVTNLVSAMPMFTPQVPYFLPMDCTFSQHDASKFGFRMYVLPVFLLVGIMFTVPWFVNLFCKMYSSVLFRETRQIFVMMSDRFALRCTSSPTTRTAKKLFWPNTPKVNLLMLALVQVVSATTGNAMAGGAGYALSFDGLKGTTGASCPVTQHQEAPLQAEP